MVGIDTDPSNQTCLFDCNFFVKIFNSVVVLGFLGTLKIWIHNSEYLDQLSVADLELYNWQIIGPCDWKAFQILYHSSLFWSL